MGMRQTNRESITILRIEIGGDALPVEAASTRHPAGHLGQDDKGRRERDGLMVVGGSRRLLLPRLELGLLFSGSTLSTTHVIKFYSWKTGSQ